MAKKPINIQNIRQVSISVHDIDRAIAFYRDVLDLPFLFNAPNMAFFDCNGLRLLLSIPENERYDHPSSIIYFQVENIRESYETLLEQDVKTLGEPHVIVKMDNAETWMAFFEDPDENVLALISEVRV
ncbi:MAG TPA: VOC family protein [Bacillales bacterium]|nr:VOC family protein [Bacillales bacterium]